MAVVHDKKDVYGKDKCHQMSNFWKQDIPVLRCKDDDNNNNNNDSDSDYDKDKDDDDDKDNDNNNDNDNDNEFVASVYTFEFIASVQTDAMNSIVKLSLYVNLSHSVLLYFKSNGHSSMYSFSPSPRRRFDLQTKISGKYILLFFSYFNSVSYSTPCP